MAVHAHVNTLSNSMSSYPFVCIGPIWHQAPVEHATCHIVHQTAARLGLDPWVTVYVHVDMRRLHTMTAD